uniref:Ribosomal RNA-processing protein 8 n=1 Tax=Ditylenchus dipsaci TaxID=166011 RepID=A0A915DW09_9BILA
MTKADLLTVEEVISKEVSTTGGPSKAKKRPWRQKVRREAKKARLALEKEQNPTDDPNLQVEKTDDEKKKKRRRKKFKGMPEETEVPKSTSSGPKLSDAATRLVTSRFRFLNEQLYTKSSKEAARVFAEDGDAFEAYHKGYELQALKWPTNPIDTIIRDLSTLPDCSIVADVGCGDAKLSRKLGSRFIIHSFDLVARNASVVVADMSSLPLKKSSVDVAVYCLSLMNTNLTEFFREANRILKKGGKLKIAEVASRFRSVTNFTTAVEKMGFSLKRKKSLHQFFILMTFEKTGKVENKRPFGLILNPCLYKKR